MKEASNLSIYRSLYAANNTLRKFVNLMYYAVIRKEFQAQFLNLFLAQRQVRIRFKSVRDYSKHKKLCLLFKEVRLL